MAYINFPQHVPQIGYHSKVSWVSRRNRNLLLWSQLIPLYFRKVWRRSIRTLWWKNQKRAYFDHVCTHPPCIRSQELLKFTKIFTVVECQHTEWRQGVSFFPNTRHKLVTIDTPLEQAVTTGIYCHEADLPTIFVESLVKINPGTLV